MVNVDLVGRQFAAQSFEVSAAKIREFARATRVTHPAHFDAEAARALGASDLVAPLTFVITPAQDAERLYMSDPESGIVFERVVHGGQEFHYHRPAVAGDVLSATYTVESIAPKPTMTIIVGRIAIVDAAGEPVAEAISTIIERAEA